MHLHPQRSARFARIFGYVGVALIAAWSLLAIAVYGGSEALVAWFAGRTGTEGWVSSLLTAAAAIDGPLIALIWAIGAALLVGLTFAIRRMAASLR
jgi:hypothetical protein